MRQKFMVGDLVRVIRVHEGNKVIVGWFGKIVAYQSCAASCADHAMYGVKFPKNFPHGHDLYQDGWSHCRQGHGWWIPAAKLSRCTDET